MSGYRKERLEKTIRMIVAESLIKDIKDPRIGFVTVTGVELNRDKTIATVSVSIMGDEKIKRKTLNGLNSAKGFFQFKIGKSIKTRNTPKIKFELDTTIDKSIEMEELFDKIEKERLENKSEHINS